MTDTRQAPRFGAPLATGRRNRWPWLVGGTVLVAVVVFVLAWFQPQKLFIDERVDEAVPGAVLEPAPGATAPPSTAGLGRPTELARGDFVSIDHGTSGVALILDLGGGTRSLRLEALDIDNGPDLFVYLSTNPAGGSQGGFDDDFVNLGPLKGNQGNQNYEVPPGTELSRFASVVIWCDRFDSAFGAADLVSG